jgi:anti-anti-sigma factor
MESLHIEITQSQEAPEVAIVHFSGELDSLSTEKIHRTFDLVLQENYVFVVADMAKVKAISSAVLGELMGCRTHLVERGGDLVFAELSLPLHEKLTAMDANKIFKFYTDVRSSLNAYNWEYKGRSESLELKFPSRLNFVPPARSLVRRIAKQKGYGNKDSFRIETIVDEVCNNAIEHGLISDEAEVVLGIIIDRKKIELKIANTSDPEKVKALKAMSKTLGAPKVGDDDKRGRGLALIKMLSNDFHIEYSDVGTSVHVTKVRED